MKRVAFALLVACHTPSATPNPTTSTSASVPLPLPLPLPTTANATPPVTVSDAAVAQPPQYIEDLEAWLHARNANAPAALKKDLSCTAEKLGTNDALLCHPPPEPLPGGESVYPITVWIISNGKAELALSAASGAGPLDREIMPGEPAPDDMYVEFDVTISGPTLAIVERPQKPCAKVLAEYKSRDDDGHRRVVQKACAARGRYVLQNGKLVRAP